MQEDGIEKTQLVPTKRDRQERADTAQRVTSKQRGGGSSPSWRARVTKVLPGPCPTAAAFGDGFLDQILDWASRARYLLRSVHR